MKETTTKLSVTTIAICVVIGIAGFFGGMKYEMYRVSKNRNQMMGQFQGQRQAGAGGQFGGNRTGIRMMGGSRPVAGEILTIDEKSMTVKMMDGSSKIVILSEKTNINKAEQATKTDLKAGERVNVFGTDNSDGSITAANIQLNPIMRIETTPGK